MDPVQRLNRSCIDCTKRKVRCDGGYPCRNCLRHDSPQLCSYRQRTKRHVVNKRTYDQLVDQVHTYADILAKAFPGISLDELASKDALELAQLNPRQPPSALPQPTRHLDQLTGSAKTSAAPNEDSDTDEHRPDRTWNESTRPTIVATDDNNAVSVATNQSCRLSFLGVTSMRTALRAIFRVYPAAKDHVILRAKEWSTIELAPCNHTNVSSTTTTENAFGSLKEQRCIDFFFESIHPSSPFLNEEQFRNKYKSGPHDASWLSLLYVVLALGSISSGSDTLHEVYYQKARLYLNLDTLGAGNLESLQALCIFGGYYLHYRNSPNMAFAILGAANRMAIALGLHREEGLHGNTVGEAEQQELASRVEAHRRTWWGLFCLDTWMSMSLGRPTCGRWDGRSMDALFPSPTGPGDFNIRVMQANCALCLICNRIQDHFARLGSPLTPQEALAFDLELTNWYESLPPLLLAAPESQHRPSTAGEFVRIRYKNVRLILFRIILLRFASDSSRHQLTPDEARILDMSRAVTTEAIDAIALYWVPNRLQVWTSAWYLFQACMIPLLILAIDKTPRHIETPQNMTLWRGSVAKALETFAEMRPWMRTSDRTPDVIAALFDAMAGDHDAVNTEAAAALFGSGFQDAEAGFMGWYDDHWGFEVDLNWESLQMDTGVQDGTTAPI